MIILENSRNHEHIMTSGLESTICRSIKRVSIGAFPSQSRVLMTHLMFATAQLSSLVIKMFRPAADEAVDRATKPSAQKRLNELSMVRVSRDAYDS